MVLITRPLIITFDFISLIGIDRRTVRPELIMNVMWPLFDHYSCLRLQHLPSDPYSISTRSEGIVTEPVILVSEINHGKYTKPVSNREHLHLIYNSQKI